MEFFNALDQADIARSQRRERKIERRARKWRTVAALGELALDVLGISPFSSVGAGDHKQSGLRVSSAAPPECVSTLRSVTPGLEAHYSDAVTPEQHDGGDDLPTVQASTSGDQPWHRDVREELFLLRTLPSTHPEARHKTRLLVDRCEEVFASRPGAPDIPVATQERSLQAAQVENIWLLGQLFAHGFVTQRAVVDALHRLATERRSFDTLLICKLLSESWEGLDHAYRCRTRNEYAWLVSYYGLRAGDVDTLRAAHSAIAILGQRHSAPLSDTGITTGDRRPRTRKERKGERTFNPQRVLTQLCSHADRQRRAGGGLTATHHPRRASRNPGHGCPGDTCLFAHRPEELRTEAENKHITTLSAARALVSAVRSQDLTPAPAGDTGLESAVCPVQVAAHWKPCPRPKQPPSESPLARAFAGARKAATPNPSG